MAAANSLEDGPSQMGTDKRKKSAGGVFLTLLKKDSRFTPELRKKVFKVEKERRK